ncbi:MAG: hypothetical protein GC136_10960, partial [Alphaproteobacteria bacterium]|nr:hypothetical protein [Alphaproteobacteria bacterium]
MARHFTAANLGTLLNYNIRYGVSIGRRQPMHRMHMECIREIEQAGLVPIIGVGSCNSAFDANGQRDPWFDPLANPLTFVQNAEQIRQMFPAVVILPIPDVGDPERWAVQLAALLNNVDFLKRHGLNVNEGIAEQCVVHYRVKPLAAGKVSKDIMPLSAYDKVLHAQNISTWASSNARQEDDAISSTPYREKDLRALTAEDGRILAAPDYLLKLAKTARASHSAGAALDKAGVPVTMADLTLSRL